MTLAQKRDTIATDGPMDRQTRTGLNVSVSSCSAALMAETAAFVQALLSRVRVCSLPCAPRSADADVGGEADVEAGQDVLRVACQLQCGPALAGKRTVGVVEAQLQRMHVVLDVGPCGGLPEACAMSGASM